MRSKLQKLLTFNQDNKDILELLNDRSNASQYVCEAVRFYEQYKSMANSMTRIEQKIDLISNKLGGMNMVPSMDEEPDPVTENMQQVSEIIDNDLKHLILNEED